MSWETQHKSRNPADGIMRPFTACNDIDQSDIDLARYAYQVDLQYETWCILVCWGAPNSHLLLSVYLILS